MTRPNSKPFSKTDALIRELLDWTAERPRTYGETMDAWGTSCPAQAIWEDAIDARLVAVAAAPGARQAERPVRLTDKGRARIGAA
jgi:hypothetical protein